MWDVVSSIVGLVALLLAALGVYQMGKVGDKLQDDIALVVKAALETISADGAETRKTIADVHKSIKEELH